MLLPKLASQRSVTFLGGAASRAALPGTAGLATVNGGLEAVTRTLAKELAPRRVNLVSPGLTDTEAYAYLSEQARSGMFADAASRLPVGRVGSVNDIAGMVLSVIQNGYVTGAVIDVDGGTIWGRRMDRLGGESVRLRNGVAIPRVGLGVFRTAPGAETRRSVEQALAIGYRHIDTAAAYRNEADVGAALAASGLPRSELFVTTKVWNQDQGYETTLKAFEHSRAALGLNVVDLYLLHWPVQGKRLDSWRALESLYERGEVRAIGVSNFMIHHLEELMAHARIAPMVNQVEVHPLLQQREVRAWCARHDIVVEAHSPLAKATALSHPVVVDVASRCGMTPAQALLAWGLQHGLVVLPKSVDPQRQKDNLSALSIQLPHKALTALDGLERGTTTGWDPREVP